VANSDIIPCSNSNFEPLCLKNVWSAFWLQGKSEEWIDRSAQMYSAFVWRVKSPGHDELRCVLFLINGTVMEDHFQAQVASTPLGTVRLRPFDSEKMKAWRVDQRVNNVRNNDASLSEPLKDENQDGQIGMFG
jgi:putative SOS response-associated peptidase YedK